MVINGPKKFCRINVMAVLTRVFLQENVEWICQAANKSGCNNEVAVRWGFTVPNSRNLEKCTSVQLTFFLCFGPFRLLPKISPHYINQNTLNVFVLRIIIPQSNKD